MKRLGLVSMGAVAAAVLVAALALVAWRQNRARDLLVRLDSLRQERALAEGRAGKLVRRVHHLESRGRVVPAARQRLGMYIPQTSEIVILSGAALSDEGSISPEGEHR